MFAYLHRKLYEELLQPDDDFFTRCRKAVISACFIFGVINIFTNTAAALMDEWSVLSIVTTVLSYLVSLIWIASWMYAKSTRTSPDWLINLDMEMGLGFMVITHFSSPNWGCHALCLSVAIAAVFIGTSHMKFQVGVSCFLFGLNVYDVLGFPSILLPGSYEGNTLIRQILNGVAASLALWEVYAAMKQFCLLIAKSAANVRMAKEVAKMLAAYDTTGGPWGDGLRKRISPPSLLSLTVVEMGLWVS